jgi:hypothetical protein
VLDDGDNAGVAVGKGGAPCAPTGIPANASPSHAPPTKTTVMDLYRFIKP